MASSTSGLPTSTLNVRRKIHQSIPSGSVKRGPHAIVRSADLNPRIEILRLCGEGSKPLFARNDIKVNQINLDGDRNTGHDGTTDCKSKLNPSNPSTESSSPERYRHRDSKKRSSPTTSRRKSPERSSRNERPSYSRNKPSYDVKYSGNKTDRYKRREKSKSTSPSLAKKKPVEKIPYYRDEQREKDRLRRLYGRSCSPPESSSARMYSPVRERRNESSSRRPLESRERHRRHSPYRSSRRDYRRHRSRTRSPQRRQIHKHSSRPSRDRDKQDKEDPNTLTPTNITTIPQYIPIPVAVPSDYAAYSIPGWPSQQPPWHPSHHRPPPASQFGPIPIMQMIPPLRPPHPASYGVLPPSLSYAPIMSPYRPHAPQRFYPPRNYANNYQSRSKKPS